MSNKNLKTLFIILLILGIILAAKTYLPMFFAENSKYLDKLKTINTKSIKTIEISKGKDKLILKNENNVWKINSKKADTTKIDNFLTSLKPATAPDLISQSEKRFNEFEISDNQAAKIKLDDKITILIGKFGTGGIYARISGSPRVYLLKNASYPLTTAKDWYDTTVFSTDQSKITKLSLQNDNTSFSVIKKNNKWIKEDSGKEVKSDKMDNILSTLSSLKADSLAEKNQISNYPETPTLSLNIQYDKKNETLTFFKGDSDYLVIRHTDDEKFIISNYTVSSLISAPDDL